MFAVLHVIQNRDLWDIIALATELILFGTGIVSFVYWVISMRRRPEADIGWAHRLPGTTEWTPWPAETPLAVVEGSTVSIRIIATNVGDSPADHAVSNVVVPASLNAVGEGSDLTTVTTGVGHPIVGSDAALLVWERHWSLGLTWIHVFKVDVPLVQQGEEPDTHILMFEVSHASLNASGRRWLPVLHRLGTVKSLQEPKRPETRLRMIRTQDHVYCRIGSRYDFREIQTILEICGDGSNRSASRTCGEVGF